MIEWIMNAILLLFLLYSFYQIIKLKEENEKLNAEIRMQGQAIKSEPKETPEETVDQHNKQTELKPIEEAEAQPPKRKKHHIPARQIKRQNVKHRG